MKFILSLMLLMTPLMAAADCLPSSQADEFFKTFKVFKWSREQASYVPVRGIANLCDNNDLSVRIAKAVQFMNGLNSQQDPKSPSVVTREGAGHYFTKRIARIVIEPKNGFGCPSGVIAYVFRGEKDIMHICTEGVTGMDSPLMMSWVLVHEARHTEGYSHVHCTHGLYLNSDNDHTSTGSCDDSYETQGSYGVAAGFLAEVLRTTKDPVQKQAARSQYVVDLIQRFNKLPLDIKPGFVAHNENGEVSFYDGANKSTLFVTSTKAFLTSRQDLPTVFDPAGSVKSYYFNKIMQDTPGGYARDYAEKYAPSQRESLRDTYYGTAHDYSCLLFDTKLRCGDNYAADPDIDVPISIRPVQFLLTSKSEFVENNVLYVVGDDGYVYPLPKDWKSFKDWSKSGQLVRSSKQYNLLSLANITGDLEYAVTFEGQLVKRAKLLRTWAPLREYKGEKIQKIVAPFFWSKTLDGI
ncbi:MAG: hypothetical protein JSU04_18915 [Bdellovibrionales bacterium]|nr:hypothetical protein [Bdellovibrionales bacterium]